MEYCSGPSLAQRYKRETFGVEDALRIGVRLSSAIATAHAAGILHRDIKPGNVLTNAFGWPALTDFGISSTLEEELPVHTTSVSELQEAGNTGTGSAQTSSAQSVGLSVPWSPPEMFEDDPIPDVRSDVFSLAATIHTLLAGRTPFEVPGRSNGTLDLIGRIERGVITPIGREDIPRSIDAVLRKGMATGRTDRFASAVDFARALQRVELELGYSPTGIEVPNLVVAPVEREPAENPDEETRLRRVSSVAVQEPAPPRRPEPEPDQEPAESTRRRAPISVEQTVLRPKTAAAAPVAEPGETPEAPAESHRRHLGILIGGGIAAVVVAAAIVAAIVVPGLGNPAPAPTDRGHGGTITVSTIPTPVFVSAKPSSDGTSVTFTWKDPKPKKDDTFLWSRVNNPDKNNHADTPTAVVTGVAPGSKVCINVAVVRNGQTSPKALKACTS